MLEGKGLLALDITSTGIIIPFIVNKQIAGPYVYGKLGKKNIRDVFDTQATFRMEEPIKTKNPTILRTPEGGLKLEVPPDQIGHAKFGLNQYIVYIFNSNVGSLLTKEFLSESEKTVYAEHTINYLTRVIEDLTRYTRDFGRHIVDTLRPKAKFFENKWVVIIIFIIIGIILMVLVIPLISQVAQSGALPSLAGLGAVTPIG